jgi:hypothetical protein
VAIKDYPTTAWCALATAVTTGFVVRGGPVDLIELIVPALQAVATGAVALLEKRDRDANSRREEQQASDAAEDGSDERGASRVAGDLPAAAHPHGDVLLARVVHPLADAEQQKAEPDGDKGSVFGHAARAENGDARNDQPNPPMLDLDAVHAGSPERDRSGRSA